MTVSRMETQLRLVIHWKKSVYDDLLVKSSVITQYKKDYFDESSCDKTAYSEANSILRLTPRYLNNKKINSYAVSAYVYHLKNSQTYHQCAVMPLQHYAKLKAAKEKCGTVIFIKLGEPEKQFLDYRWGERAAEMALEKCEVDHAMSWLSTLGGAFSALGEQFQHCAQMAGKISIHQFTLALRLQDPLLVARCKLYAALSIIQQGNLQIPKIIIQDIFKFAREQKDAHLQRMCQGVWAKLKYCYKLRKQQRKQLRM